MRTHRSRNPLGLRSTVLVVAALSVLTALAAASPALATPKGDFAVYAQCPVADPEVNLCFHIPSIGGEFSLGAVKVPIDKTITLQGGSIVNEETGSETFVDAANGETLSKTPLTVPGGLLGITAPESLPKWLREIFEKFVNGGLNAVTATIELVGTPEISRADLFFQEGVALTLPVRIHLGNALLGSACYVGSKASPIVLNLRTGTTSPPPPNGPITGDPGHVENIGDLESDGQVTILEVKLVENAFSEPGASGCGGSLSFLVDPALDARLGLPSAAGHNTFIFENNFGEALAEAVKNSE
jgi:hypothetical protein